MKPGKTIYHQRAQWSGAFMILTLLWLTVSTPFVYAGQQSTRQWAQKHVGADVAEDGPFSNTTEEKNSGSANLFSEYLHDHVQLEHPAFFFPARFPHLSAGLYLAYHPELISPPPEL